MALSNLNKAEDDRLKAAARKNSQATPDEKGPDVVEEISIIYQNEKYVLRTDGGDLDARNKLTGHGFTITQQGDFIFVSGPGGKGNPCGGRFMINTTGGQITKNDGPNIEENTASPTSAATEGKEGSGEEAGLAKSVVCNGNHLEECHGQRRIFGTHVVIEAADKLVLKGMNGIVMQAGPTGGGELTMQAGTIKQITGNMETVITGQKTELTSESKAIQIDPRGTTATVSTGSKAETFVGDLKQTIIGSYQVTVAGSKKPTLNFNPKNALSFTCAAGDIKLSTKIGSIFCTAGIAKPSFADFKPGAFFAQAVAGVKIENIGPKTNVDILSELGDINLEAKAGGANITAATDVKVVGLKIYLN